MINWVLRKVFYSKRMDKIRRSFYYDAYYQGQHDLMWDEIHRGKNK